jgi:hypothetical protein
MATVYVKNITAFDATNAQIINFGYFGNQCTKNRIVIYNSSTNASVYDDTVTTYNLAHTIPAATLTNGTSYYCTVTAYYSVNNIEYSVTSSSSNVFKCLATAIWNINGLSDGSVIGNSYYDFTMTYSQAQSETVNEYYIVLYDASGSIYWTSGALYDTSATTRVSGLPNNTVFCVRAYGTTTNGLPLDTRNSTTGADLTVTVDYTVPSIYSIAELENSKWDGWIKVSSNFATVEGVSDSTAVYINNDYADLTSNSVTFNSGVLISGDYIIEAQAYNIKPNSSFIKISGTDVELTIMFKQMTLAAGTKFFAELSEKNSGFVLYSNYLDVPASTDLIHVWLQRKSGLFGLTIANKGAVS